MDEMNNQNTPQEMNFQSPPPQQEQPQSQFEKISSFSFKGKFAIIANIITFVSLIGGLIAMFFIFDFNFG